MDLFKLMPTGLAWAGKNIKKLFGIAQNEFARLENTLDAIPFESLPTHTHQLNDWEDALLLQHDETKSLDERRQEICKKFLTNIGNDMDAYRSIAKIYDPNSMVLSRPYIRNFCANVARAGQNIGHKQLAPSTVYFVFYIKEDKNIIKDIDKLAQGQVEFKYIFLPFYKEKYANFNRIAGISAATKTRWEN